MARAQGSVLWKIVWLLLSLLVVGGIGLGIFFLYRYTNGFTESFKSFLVSYEGRDLAASSSMDFSGQSEVTFGVRYLFENGREQPKGYTVRVETAEGDFDYTVDGLPMAWEEGEDVTAFFSLEKGTSSFTLHIPEAHSAKDALQSLYPEQTVECPMDSELPSTYLYRLIVSSENGAVTYTVNFSVYSVASYMETTPGHIIFGGGA